MKKILCFLIFITLLSNCVYSKNFNSTEELRLHLESNFHQTVSKININELTKDINNNLILNTFEANGIVVHLDDNHNLIEDVRYIYKDVSDYAIAINRSQMMLTVFTYNPEKQIFNIPIVSFPISCNYSRTPLGTHYTTDKYRWRALYGGHYGQYCTRYSENLLFHSALYASPYNTTLEANTYNSIIDKVQSGGCVRLRTKDAKWIYDNVKPYSLVIVYDGVEEAPFKREIFDRIDNNQDIDPTDEEYIKLRR